MRNRVLKTSRLALLLAGLACLSFVSGQESKAPAAESLESLRGRAEKGDADAQFNLGLMYYQGRGVPQDYAEAVRWYRRAALQGNPGSQFNLASMYCKKQWVTEDFVEAYMWVSLAAMQLRGDQKGFADAQGELARMMSSQQIDEAQRRLKDLGRAGPGRVFRVGQGVSLPKLISKVEAKYSDRARKAKLSCMVLLEIEINERGFPQNPRVLREVPSYMDSTRTPPRTGCLDLAGKAIEAIMQWRFRPGSKDGMPVTVASQVEINFRLK